MRGDVPPPEIAAAFLRATQSAALAAQPWVGRNDKYAADLAAVTAMRHALRDSPMTGVVVIGEGEKDHAPMLGNGELVGNRRGPRLEIAVDPIDGTSLAAAGHAGALAVMAAVVGDGLFDPGPYFYMKKIAVGPGAKGSIDVTASVAENLASVSAALCRPVSDLTVVVVERPRHHDLMAEIRRCGAQLQIVPEGDIAAAIRTALPSSGVDVLMSIGGTPEGVIAAVALELLGGEFQGQLHVTDPDLRHNAASLGYDVTRVLGHAELVGNGPLIFSATGITGGALLDGVTESAEGLHSHSLLLTSGAAPQFLSGEHSPSN